MANFPIVNANLYIKNSHKRLMQPHIVLKKGGLSIQLFGIITEKVMDSISRDPTIGSFILLEEASAKVGRICDAYKNDDIDLTVLLAHIGFDSDKELAHQLNPTWGIDMIIGGHSANTPFSSARYPLTSSSKYSGPSLPVLHSPPQLTAPGVRQTMAAISQKILQNRLPKKRKPIQNRGDVEGFSTRAVVLVNDSWGDPVPVFENTVLISRSETWIMAIAPMR
ncbi:MAG: hypothetical protein WCF90_02620 [Methanomicrobiales archaeon]